MVRARSLDGVVRRVEDAIEAAVHGYDCVTLAYSGGLASTLIAMVARKRCDLRCIVAGVEGSPDVEAAKVAKNYLDYRIEFVPLDAKMTRKTYEELVANRAQLSETEREDLIPLFATLARTDDPPVLAGFGTARLSPAMRATIEGAQVQLPLRGFARGRAVPRATLRDAALALGLPSSWARVRHHAPCPGAGVDDFLEEKRRAMR